MGEFSICLAGSLFLFFSPTLRPIAHLRQMHQSDKKLMPLMSASLNLLYCEAQGYSLQVGTAADMDRANEISPAENEEEEN
ncbi:hypothetical protein T05_7093 [Trichinella murrelli]|uniref:Uncharacterized protein n=1 Tax=Trichinella murrelli TaxID=144512 RepID=A0A0V0TU36_9BILA|nr:hypothetical protein T05_7093 [Trichinella murrelli]